MPPGAGSKLGKIPRNRVAFETIADVQCKCSIELDLRRERWASGQMVAKPISIKDAKRKLGGCRWKAVGRLQEGRAGDCSPHPDYSSV
jgi:hypothetical protein